MSVLITSLSRKVPLIKGARYALEKSGEGKVVGGDTDPLCIGRFFVDQFWEMPPLVDLQVEELIAYCQFYKINKVIPTRDGELLFFAKHRMALSQQGITVMVSSEESLEPILDKLKFYHALEGLGYPGVETSEQIEKWEGNSFVVKERFGAGSRKIGINLTRKEALEHAKTLKTPLFQPYIPGEEVSVDLYLDKTGKAKGVVLRRREMVLNGESQITTTFRNSALEEQCVRLAEELDLYGHVMFQLLIHQETDVHYFLECNPRFGGASTLSVAAGLDSLYWFFIEASGKSLALYPFERSLEEKRLVRYPEDLILT